MQKVLIIGGSGMVASRIIDLWQDKFEIVSADEKTLDITNEKAVKIYFENNTFDTVINFAAFTNVDSAEAQKGDENGLVWKLNVNGPKYLAEVCKQKNIFLVHISTDFVFPGDNAYPGPYSEDSLLPESDENIGWYGWSKNRAEKVLSVTSAKYAVIRYGYPFRSADFEAKKDWARNLINLYNENKMYPLFHDQIQSILYIDDLAAPLAKIIEEKLSGVFHIASSDTTTPYDAGVYLLRKYTGKSPKVDKGSMTQFLSEAGRTPRPRLGGLKVEKTEKELGMKFRTWREMVDDFVSQLAP